MEDETTKVIKAKTAASLKRIRVFYAVLMYTAAILAIACLIGIVVGVLILNFSARTEQKTLLLYILTGSFAGGA